MNITQFRALCGIYQNFYNEKAIAQSNRTNDNLIIVSNKIVGTVSNCSAHV
jgi:hypothetical protein